MFQNDVGRFALTLFQWFSLEDVSQGKLHLRLEWLAPLATPEELDQVGTVTPDPVSAATPPIQSSGQQFYGFASHGRL